MILGESVTAQHRVVVLDIFIRRWKRRDIRQRDKETQGLRVAVLRERQDVFKDKIIKEGKWNLDKDVDKMWNEMTTCIKRVAKDILGESKGCGKPTKETWWWNTELQATIKLKREAKCRLNVGLMINYIASWG